MANLTVSLSIYITTTTTTGAAVVLYSYLEPRMLLDLGRPCTSQPLRGVLVQQPSNETLAVEGEVTWNGSRAVKNSSTKFRGGGERER